MYTPKMTTVVNQTLKIRFTFMQQSKTQGTTLDWISTFLSKGLLPETFAVQHELYPTDRFSRSKPDSGNRMRVAVFGKNKHHFPN